SFLSSSPLSPSLSPLSFFSVTPPPPRSTLFPYTTLFRSSDLRFGHTSASIDPVHWCGSCLHSCSGRYSAVPFAKSLQRGRNQPRSEEHTSELQSRFDLVCRLLLEKKKQ